MKKALIILANYDPNPSSVANCMKPLIKELSNFFEVDILTDRERIDVLAEETQEHVKIYRVEDFRKMNTIHLNELKKIQSTKFLKAATNLTSFLLKVLYYFRYTLPAPEKITGGWEIERVYDKFEQLHASHDYELVISASLPFQSHLVGEKIKDSYGDKIKWAIFEFDPYTFNDTLKSSSRRRKRMYNDEKKVFEKCDHIFLTPELYSFYKKENHFNLESKVTQLPYANLTSISFNADQVKGNLMPDDKINCLFTGTLYSDIRSPELMLKLFSKVQPEIGLSLMTNLSAEQISKYAPTGYTPNVIRFQKRDTSLYNLTQANVLVNIGNTVEHQVPGKIFEYMSTGKPIIHFSKIPNDPSVKYLEKYPKILLINEWEIDKIDYTTMINEFCIENSTITLPFQEVSDSLGEYSGVEVRKKFVRIIHEMLGEKS